MVGASEFSRLGWAFLIGLLLPSAAAADGLVVQQIGEVRGRIAEAVAEEAVFAGVAIVPLSRRLAARTTPIILAAGKVFLSRDGKRVLGLRPAERSALRRAYDAGEVILLLDASTHDIEALHVLLKDGVAHESSTDPVVLAYALRQENDIPTARLVTHPLEDAFGEDLDEDELDEAELALSRAIEIVIEELTRPRAAPEDDAAASSTNWKNSPVHVQVLELSERGTYNTPVEIYALHSCRENMDYYLVDTGGTWTPERARYESADQRRGQMRLDSHLNLDIDWQPGEQFCDGGFEVSGNGGPGHICRYMDYPLFYQVDIVPLSGRHRTAGRTEGGAGQRRASGRPRQERKLHLRLQLQHRRRGRGVGRWAERRFSGRRHLGQLRLDLGPAIGDRSRQPGQPRDVYEISVLHGRLRRQLHLHHSDGDAFRAMPELGRRPTAKRPNAERSPVQCRSDGQLAGRSRHVYRQHVRYHGDLSG
jgi:hypothetical protein